MIKVFMYKKKLFANRQRGRITAVPPLFTFVSQQKPHVERVNAGNGGFRVRLLNSTHRFTSVFPHPTFTLFSAPRILCASGRQVLSRSLSLDYL